MFMLYFQHVLFKFEQIQVIFHQLFHTFASTGIWYRDKIISLVLFSIHNLIKKCFSMMSLIPDHITLFWKQKDSSPVQEIGDQSNN